MAKRRPRDEDEEDEEVTVKKPRRQPSGPRMSLSLPSRARKRVKLAAALADLEVGEWCRVVLAQAAHRTVEKAFPNLGATPEEDD